MTDKIILIGLTILVLSLSGCIDDSPYEIMEIACGTVKNVEGNKIFFENDSYSGIIEDSGSIRWDGSLWYDNQWVSSINIDNLNGYDISNLTGKFIEIRIHGVMDENDYLYSTLISIEIIK